MSWMSASPSTATTAGQSILGLDAIELSIRSAAVALVSVSNAEESQDSERLQQAMIACAAEFTPFEGTIPVSGIVNALLRHDTLIGEMRAVRLLMTILPTVLPAVSSLDCSQLRFSDGCEAWLAHAISNCATTLRNLSFMMCQGLSPEKFVCILRAIPPTIERITVSKKLFDTLFAAGKIPEALAPKFVLKSLGGCVTRGTLVQEAAVPLREAIEQQRIRSSTGLGQSEADRPSGLPEAQYSSGALLTRGSSDKDTVWAEQVFSQHRIPLENLFSGKGKRLINRYVEMLRSSDHKSRVQAEDIQQARLFLIRDPSVVAREELRIQRKRDRRRHGGGGGDADSHSDDEYDDTFIGAVEVLKRYGISVKTAINDIITVQDRIEAMVRRGEKQQAASLNQAVDQVRRCTGISTSFKDASKGEQYAQAAQFHGLEREDEAGWAQLQLRQHKFAEADVYLDGGRLVQETIDRLNRSSITALSAQKLQRAVQIITRLRSQSLRSPSAVPPCETLSTAEDRDRRGYTDAVVVPPLSEMDHWARTMLRKLFQVDYIDQLLVARVEDIDEELERLSRSDAAVARCAMKLLQEIKYGRGVAEETVNTYRQLAA